jgi:hypothetical protein
MKIIRTVMLLLSRQVPGSRNRLLLRGQVNLMASHSKVTGQQVVRTFATTSIHFPCGRVD